MIFCNMKYLFDKCLSVFVWWAVCNLSVCRKVNRQYKHKFSCTVHDHPRPYRWITFRRYFTESYKIFIGNATITDDFADGLPSVGIQQRGSLEMPQSLTDDFVDRLKSVSIPQRGSLEMPQSPTTLLME
jgi:hypothetical protein